MTPLQRKVALARWRDKSFVYHGSESHNDASEFRARMRAYRQQAARNVPYPEFCRHPDKCAGLGSCPRDPTCAD